MDSLWVRRLLSDYYPLHSRPFRSRIFLGAITFQAILFHIGRLVPRAIAFQALWTHMWPKGSKGHYVPGRFDPRPLRSRPKRSKDKRFQAVSFQAITFQGQMVPKGPFGSKLQKHFKVEISQRFQMKTTFTL